MYPEKYRARYKLKDAVRTGKIKRGVCALLGSDCKGQIEGHHPDYSKPLEVVWVCRHHHNVIEGKTAEQNLKSYQM